MQLYLVGVPRRCSYTSMYLTGVLYLIGKGMPTSLVLGYLKIFAVKGLIQIRFHNENFESISGSGKMVRKRADPDLQHCCWKRYLEYS